MTPDEFKSARIALFGAKRAGRVACAKALKVDAVTVWRWENGGRKENGVADVPGPVEVAMGLLKAKP